MICEACSSTTNVVDIGDKELGITELLCANCVRKMALDFLDEEDTEPLDLTPYLVNEERGV